MEGIVLWIIYIIIFFFFLYLVIQSAIDNSTMAQNIQEIRDEIVQKKTLHASQSTLKPNDELVEEEPLESNDDIDEACPACGAIVKGYTKVCPGCGLTLSNS